MSNLKHTLFHEHTAWHCWSSHQGSRVKLQNDMLHEDKQVGRPVLQALYAVEVNALVLHCLKARGNTYGASIK